MMQPSKTIVFFGSDEFSAASLIELIAQGFTIGAVVTKPDSRKGRGRTLSASIIKEIAEAHNIPVLQPTDLATIIEPISKLDTPIGVLVSYGKIIPQAIIDLFSPGIVNVHPSLLPRYRGPSPIETALLQGDLETGITIMSLSAKMDAGPIYSQVTVPLQGNETAPELETQLAALGAQELSLKLPAIMTGLLEPVAQHDDVATYCALLRKEEALLDTSLLTAEQAERQVRAYLAFPKTKTTVAGQQIVITKAHIANAQLSPLDVRCADGRYLAIDELIGPSGKKMDAQSFINGYTK